MDQILSGGKPVIQSGERLRLLRQKAERLYRDYLAGETIASLTLRVQPSRYLVCDNPHCEIAACKAHRQASLPPSEVNR